MPTHNQLLHDLVEFIYDYLPSHPHDSADIFDWEELTSNLQMRSGTRLFIESQGSSQIGIWNREVRDLDMIAKDPDLWLKQLNTTGFTECFQSQLQDFLSLKYATPMQVETLVSRGNAVDGLAFTVNNGTETHKLELEVFKDIIPALPTEQVMVMDSSHRHYFTVPSSDIAAILGKKLAYTMLFDMNDSEQYEYPVARRECAKNVYDIGMMVLSHGSAENALMDKELTEKMRFSTLLGMLKWNMTPECTNLLHRNNWLRCSSTPESCPIKTDDLMALDGDTLSGLAKVFHVTHEEAAQLLIDAFSRYVTQLLQDIDQHPDLFTISDSNTLGKAIIDAKSPAIMGDYLRRIYTTSDGRPNDAFQHIVEGAINHTASHHALEHIHKAFMPPAKDRTSSSSCLIAIEEHLSRGNQQEL